MKCVIIAFSVCALFSLPSRGQESKVPSVDDLEKKLIEDRRGIQQMSVIFQSKTYRGGREAPDQERKTTIWMDGPKIREDRLIRIAPASDFHREVQCRNCEIEGYWLYYTEEKSDHPIALSLFPMKQEPKSNPEAYAIIDPRLLGLICETSPNLAASRSHFTSILQRPDRRNITVRPTKWLDKDSWLVEFELFKSTHWRLVFVPECGYNIATIEAEEKADGSDYHVKNHLQMELQYIQSAALWYPKKCTFLDELNGKPREKEITEVEVLSLKRPLPKELFTLAGMDIRAATPISSDLQRKSPTNPLYWDGEKIAKVELVKADAHSGVSREMWFYSSLCFAVLGSFLIWRVYRRTSNAPH